MTMLPVVARLLARPLQLERRRAPARARPARSFWRRWLDRLVARRERQADRFILQCLRRNLVRSDADLIELERRLSGR